MTLKGKQKRFVDEYLVDRNATKAAIRAGYSAKTAAVIACENLKKPNVAAAIDAADKKREKRTEIKQDDVLREIQSVAFRQASDLMTSDFKHASKARYLDMLCKCMGMYEKKPDRSTPEDDGFMDALKREADGAWQD